MVAVYLLTKASGSGPGRLLHACTAMIDSEIERTLLRTRTQFLGRYGNAVNPFFFFGGQPLF